MKYEGGIDKILKKGTDLSLGLSESGWGYPIEAAGEGGGGRITRKQGNPL